MNSYIYLLEHMGNYKMICKKTSWLNASIHMNVFIEILTLLKLSASIT